MMATTINSSISVKPFCFISETSYRFKYACTIEASSVPDLSYGIESCIYDGPGFVG